MGLGWTLNPMTVPLQRMEKDTVRCRGECRMPYKDAADSGGIHASAEALWTRGERHGMILPQGRQKEPTLLTSPAFGTFSL